MLKFKTLQSVHSLFSLTAFLDIMKGLKKGPSSSAPSTAPDFHGMRKNEIKACASRLGVRTRRPSAAGGSTAWRKVPDLVLDCEKAARRPAQPTLKSFLKMKRPASACMTTKKSAKHRNALLIAAIRDIENIAPFRKQSKALVLVVRVQKAGGQGHHWRTKQDILADYVRMLEESPCASPLALPERHPVSKLADL